MLIVLGSMLGKAIALKTGFRALGLVGSGKGTGMAVARLGQYVGGSVGAAADIAAATTIEEARRRAREEGR